jgi:hypothetical protein
MIELTEEQRQAMQENPGQPLRLVDPTTQQTYVVIRKEHYDLLTDPDYDDSPWTPEERMTLAWEAGKHAGWEDTDEFDDYPEKP